MTTTFPHFVLRGSHREVGRQHGEALRSRIRAHLGARRSNHGSSAGFAGATLSGGGSEGAVEAPFD